MKSINILLYSDPNEGTTEFVEIEDDNGHSIDIGSIADTEDDGYYKIRITEEDIKRIKTNG